MLNTYEKNARAKLITTIVAVVVIAGIVVLADHFKAKNTSASTVAQNTIAGSTGISNDNSASNTTPNSSTNTATPDNSNTTTSGTYKDGDYSASNTYIVPHSQEEIDVNLTLKDDTITAVSIQNSEGDRDSAAFQEDFASLYKQYVVGQKISGLRLHTLAGASDTTDAFNNALSQIAAKAQA